jgi:hypothetical protein
MAKPSKSSIFIEKISRYAATRGVVIHLDGDDNSYAASLGEIFYFEPDGKILTIVLSQLTQEEEVVVRDIVLKYWDKHGLFLSAEQEKILENYQGYTAYNPYTDILDLFTGKIPKQDLYALKMSLFMKVQSEAGENVDKIKRQIKDRFGIRGAYIANLCTAGYYEDIFRSQCFKLQSDKFTEYYELRVGGELAALFVHIGLTLRSMEVAFAEKVNGCQLNDILKFRVLGFGRRNFDLIDNFKQTYEDHDWGTDIRWDLRMESSGPHIGIEYDINLL